MQFTACLLLVFLASGYGAPQFDEKYGWSREVQTYSGKEVEVWESALVDSRQQIMLMSAQDVKLRATPFYRSESMHDFKTGLVALKPEGATICLFGPVKQSYDETVKELERRRQEGRPAADRRVVEAVSAELLDRTDSDVLNAFCEQRSFIKFQDSPPWTTGFPPRWPPMWCIWGPVDPVFPWTTELPLEKWQGGYGYFG